MECSRSDFRAFLDKAYAGDFYDFEEYCEDLKSKLGATGGVVYELRGFKDHDAPACFYCDLKTIEWVGSLEDLENGQHPTFVWVDQ